jgi:hypothetical protein
MTSYNVVNAGSLVAGEPEDISVILANFQAISDVINGAIDNNNLSPAAAIAIAKLANYPSDPAKVLKGDGTWGLAASGGADLSYDGDWVAGTYQDGEVVVKDGVAFVCVGGPTTEAPSLAPWGTAAVPLVGDEIAYDEKTTDTNITATTEAAAQTVLTCSPVTVDGTTAIMIDYFASLVGTSTTAGNAIALWLYDGAVSLGRLTYIQTPANGALYAPVRVSRRLTPSAGTHNYTIRASVTAGTGVVSGLAGGPGTAVPAFCRITRVVPTPPQVGVGALTAVTYGTSLPATPADGQEAILVDSMTAPTYQWHFRYNAGASGAYKWEFLGGASFTHNIATNETSTATGWFNLATAGPRFTVPRAGIYEVSYGSEMSCAGATAWLGPGVGIGDFSSVVHESLGSVQAGWIASGSGTTEMTLAAAAEIRVKYTQWNGQSSNWKHRWLNVRPKRVS